MAQLKRPGYYEYNQALKEQPDADLPFGELRLRLYQTNRGYQVCLFNPKTGREGYTGEFITDSMRLKSFDETLISAWFSRAIDHDLPYTHLPDELLLPDNIDPVIMREDGTLFCTRCGQTVENTANSEMRKEGVYADSHVCKEARHETA